MVHTINRVAVIGAGTMGAAIAAHLADAGVLVYLLDVAPRELTPQEKEQGLTLAHPSVRNRIVNEGWQRCVEARPANLLNQGAAERVTLGNREDNFAWVGEADWILEAIVERLDVKQKLMARIAEVRKPGSVVSSNTSGLLMRDIAAGRSDDFKAHFIGTHFFNPPRYLKLLEIIPHAQTRPEIIKLVKEFNARTLGKVVVICKDSPNFIANRFFSIVGAHTLNYALDHGYSVKEVDLLTGPLIGHPKAATFRLYDLIGLDVAVQVPKNLYPAIPDDPYREELRHAKNVALMQALVERGWLGNKSQQGFYKRVETEQGCAFWTLDLETLEYRPPVEPRFESVERCKDVPDVGQRIKRLCAGAWDEPDGPHDRAGQFTWATTAFALNFAASMVPGIADDILSVDQANKWGYGYALGSFELWDALGVAESVERMEADGMTVMPWVKEMLAAGHASFYKQVNERRYYYDPVSKDYVAVEEND